MRFIATLFTAALVSTAPLAQADNHSLRDNGDGTSSIFSKQQNRWMLVEDFWRQHAEQGKGKFWGQSRSYPNYDDVNEHDTLLIESEHGLCLMEFFHNRWRRANDVWRWNQQLTDYSSCPRVFD